MALSRRNPVSLGLLLLASALAPAVGATPPQPGSLELDRKQPISLDAASSEVDYKTNRVVFRNVVISQGSMKVQADHAQATGLDFDNSHWTFEGNVRINAEERGNLRSDEAVVEFRNNRIAKAIIDGSPAEFEQKRADSEQMARGHAHEIIYDVQDGSVRLSTDAWLSDGQREISGPELVYNIREQRVQASSQPGTGQQIHITIAPATEPKKP